jgi:hypothetical protein
MHRQLGAWIMVVLVAALLAGCTSADKAPAEAALKAAEAAVGAAKTEIAKYMPDQAKALDTALAAAKEKFDKGDYKGALADAQALAGKAKELGQAAAAKKEELTKSWTTLSEGLPKVVDAIQSRLDVLSKSRKLPAGLTADKLASAKTGLADITKQLAAATTAFQNGSLQDAVSMATALKAKAAEVMTILGMQVPDALRS